MAGATDALQERGDRARRTDLADQVDVADVDAKLQRRRGHEHAQVAALQSLLGIQTQFLGQAAVVCGDGILAELFGELPGSALGHPARVDEYQRGAMRLHQLGEARVDQVPLLVRHHRLQRHRRQFQRQVALLGIADIDDGAVRRRVGPDRGRTDKEARDFIDGFLRRRQPDARQPPPTQCFQSFQRQRQMAAALARDHRVNFVHDDRARRGQHRAPGFRTQQHVQRLRCRHQDVRRRLAQACALGLRRIAGAHRGADIDVRQSLACEFGGDACQRRLEVDVDVVGQRLQGRDVDDLGRIGQAVRKPFAHQRIDGRQERGERLARTGRCGDQGVAARCNRRPGLRLCLGRAGKGAREPCTHGGMECGQRGRHRFIIRSARCRRLNPHGAV